MVMLHTAIYTRGTFQTYLRSRGLELVTAVRSPRAGSRKGRYDADANPDTGDLPLAFGTHYEYDNTHTGLKSTDLEWGTSFAMEGMLKSPTQIGSVAAHCVDVNMQVSGSRSPPTRTKVQGTRITPGLNTTRTRQALR